MNTPTAIATRYTSMLDCVTTLLYLLRVLYSQRLEASDSIELCASFKIPQLKSFHLVGLKSLTREDDKCTRLVLIAKNMFFKS